MCDFFEEKFEQINKLKYLMTLARNDENLKKYRDKIEEVFNEFDNYSTREEEQDILILTPEELAGFSGKDGKPAYVAIDRMIYDVTNIELFKQSPHNELKLGKDLTNEFNECHEGNVGILNKIPVVGMLAEPEEVELIEEVEPYYSEKRLKVISTKELATYNGEGDKPAYVAIDGLVYNVTNLPFLKVDPHDELKLGTDISDEYRACHNGNKGLLEDIPVIGVLYDFPESNRGKHENQNIEPLDNNDVREFKVNELISFNGKDGKPPYIAVFGTVYDLTDIEDSKLMDVKLGCDLTGEYKEVYGNDKSYLRDIPIAGVLTCSCIEV